MKLRGALDFFWFPKDLLYLLIVSFDGFYI